MAESATDAPSAEVEAEWIRVFDSRHQRHYFFNATTGESQWIKPKGVPVAEAPEDMQARADHALGTASSSDSAAVDSKAASSPSPVESGAAADAPPDPSAVDSSTTPRSHGAQPKGGAKKLRSFAKGVANILGLRKRHASKSPAKEEMVGNPLTSPVVTAGDAGAAADGSPAPSTTAADTPASSAPTATAATSAADGAAGSADSPTTAATAAAGTSAAVEDGAATEGTGRLTRTLSDGNIKPQLKRVRSILKRSSTMHAKSERRISFADQSGRSLANVVYCDNLHYSQPDSGMAPPDPGHEDDDGNCAVM